MAVENARILYGKGVWAWRESEVPVAIEMAHAIGARIVLFKSGEGGEYFAAAPRVVRRIFDAGLVPCAWPVITCRDPEAEADVAIRSILDGYVGLVFDVEEPAAGRGAGAARLGEIMAETELPPEVMFFTSLPNISAHPGIPYLEMSRFCKGGFMPQAYASFGWPPRYTLEVATFGEYLRWVQSGGVERPIYPVLGLYRDAHGEEPLSADEVRAWLDALARYRPTFFSVYRAGVIDRQAWPLLAAFETTPRGELPPPLSPPEGEYVAVRPGETIAMLCERHGCSIEQFWEWNGHLWDARGKVRDPRLLEHGWIVRVG